MNSSKHSLPRGFTLVELLVVIGIICLLISMLMPMLSTSKQYANSIRCQSNLRNLGQMLLMYSQDNRGIPFPVGYRDPRTGQEVKDASGYPTGLGTNVGLMDRWTVVCLNKLKPNPEVMICPLDQDIGQEDLTDPFLRKDDDPRSNKHSYILNKHLIYEDIRFGRTYTDLGDSDIVLAGEKKTDYFDYYMECTVNSASLTLTSTDFYKVEPNRHGVKFRSNTVYLDTHVDNRDPYKLIPGKFLGTTAVDSRYSDPWQVKTNAVRWQNNNFPTTNPANP